MILRINEKPLPKWDHRFCELAKFISNWSKDPSSKIGAVVISERGSARGLGYNGFPKGVADSVDRLEQKDVKLDIVIHAEQNALLNAGAEANGSTIYVWGKPVCCDCAGLIIQAGIKRVVALDPETMADKTSTWYKKGVLSIMMFNEAGVETTLFEVVEASD